MTARRAYRAVVLGVAAAVMGCATARPKVTREIFGGGLHYVKLVSVLDGEGQAVETFDHPVDFTGRDMTHILSTLRVSTRQVRDWSESKPALSTAAARLLGPEVARAFNEATAEEYVAFKVTQQVRGFLLPRNKVTAGTMFLRNDEFHLQLEYYDALPEDMDRITHRWDRTGMQGTARLEPGEATRRVANPDTGRVYTHWIATDWPALQAQLVARRRARAAAAAAQAQRREEQRAGDDWHALDELPHREEGSLADLEPEPEDGAQPE